MLLEMKPQVSESGSSRRLGTLGTKPVIAVVGLPPRTGDGDSFSWLAAFVWALSPRPRLAGRAEGLLSSFNTSNLNFSTSNNSLTVSAFYLSLMHMMI